MSKSIKFAVSVPGDEFKDLEILRKKKGLTRSAFIRNAIRLWKEIREIQKLAKIYVDGYKKIPENLIEIEALEKASLGALSLEEW
jgi:metal-responsive CopG/Arc/MetJ family transcriptional regulator